MERQAVVPSHMVNKPTLIQNIATNSSCAPMALWLWKNAKMVCCSMARALFTTIATTIGPLNVENVYMTVRSDELIGFELVSTTENVSSF